MFLICMTGESVKFRLRTSHRKAYGEFSARAAVAIFVAAIAGPLFSAQHVNFIAVFAGIFISFVLLLLSANLLEFEGKE